MPAAGPAKKRAAVKSAARATAKPAAKHAAQAISHAAATIVTKPAAKPAAKPVKRSHQPAAKARAGGEGQAGGSESSCHHCQGRAVAFPHGRCVQQGRSTAS